MRAPQYHETLLSLLYPGNQTSEKSLCQTVQMVEQLWQMHARHERGHILIRLDAGFGSDSNVNWLPQRMFKGYWPRGVIFGRVTLQTMPSSGCSL